MQLLRREPYEKKTKEDFKEVLEYMGISEDRYWEVINNARSPHLWEKKDGEWTLRHRVN